MSSLKEALARVSRVVRQHESLAPKKQPTVLLPTNPGEPKHIKHSERPRLPRQKLKEMRPHLQGYLRKRFQKFLEPLQMPQLKIYDDNLPPYDERQAELNFVNKTSKDRLQVFANFLNERQVFDKMVQLLIDLTPSELMDKDIVENSSSLAHVLKREDEKFHASRYPNVPRYHFHEIPPMPHPLTKESFQKYVYYLTHSKILYRNSSSLMSGLVPEILLYTHSLDNEDFKPYRSTESFNSLIKYFGYDKFQNSFARELLLVMVKDGHTPNTNTINQLLKICRVHSNRRSLISTYKVIINYLNLAKTLELRINLSTWNRIYDCIDNIFLKEAFLNKISTVSLPVSENMCIRIFTDFCETTSDTEEVIRFLESELLRPAWKLDPRLAEKVLYHKIQHMTRNEELSVIFEETLPQISYDSLTLKTLANAIEANTRLRHRGYLILCMYTQLSPTVELVPPEVYSRVTQLFSENKEGYTLSKLNALIRAIVHHDATRMLNLPVETVEYSKHKHLHNRPRRSGYKTPDALFSEHYRIFKRFSRGSLNIHEAKVLYAQKSKLHGTLRNPWELLTQDETTEWLATRQKIMSLTKFWENSTEKAQSIGLETCSSTQVPARWIMNHERENAVQMRLSNDINTLQRLERGLDEHTKHEMKKRNIYAAD